MQSVKYLRKKDYIAFSMANFAASAIGGLAQGYLLIFYIAVLGVSPMVVGVMALIAKIFDGLNDPIMGVLVDKTHTKMGKMRPYLLFGAIPFGIITIMMFIPVKFSMTGRIVYMYITYLLYDIVGTIVGVPMGGLPTVISPDSGERTKLISISRILGSIGEQSALVLVSIGLIITGQKMGTTYLATAIVIGVLAPVFMLIAGINAKERIEPSEVTPRIMDGFRYLFKNKPFLLLILSNLLTFFRNLVSAAIIYVVTYIYSNGSLQIWFALPGAIASMLGMLIAPILKKKLEAKQIFILATIWHSVFLAVVFVIGMQAWYITACLMFVAMLPVGVLNVVPHLMAADSLDYWEDKTGLRQEGVTFSLMSLRSKVSSGLKDYVLAFLLAYFMFTTPNIDVKDHNPAQLAFTKTGLFMIFTIIPAVTNLVSIIPMLFYNLSGKKLKEIQERLAVTRAQKNTAEE